MERGVIYMTWGQKAIQEAGKSMASLWKHASTTPVFVVGDVEAQAMWEGKDKVSFRLITLDPFQGGAFMAGRIKPLLYKLSPFERSLYVDADTDFASSPGPAFDLLDKWDFIVAETETRSLKDSVAGVHETHWTRDWLGTEHILYHNSGMLFWRKNKAVEKLFDLWSAEWQRYSQWDEQIALLRALLLSEAVYLTVPYTWNCRMASKTILLHHRFGTRSAWKFKHSRGQGMTAAEMRQLAGVMRDRVERGRALRAEEIITGRQRRQKVVSPQTDPKVLREQQRQVRKPKHTARDKMLKAARDKQTDREMADVHA
jgi:hypothetical protein